jgi:acyl carrier protein
MTASEIQDGVAAIIREVLDNPTLVIDANTSAAQVERWDSLNHLNIVVAVEQKFAVKFKTVEIEKLRNVGELVALIERKLAVKG